MASKLSTSLNCAEKFFETLINGIKDRNPNLYHPQTKKAKNCKIITIESVGSMLRARKYCTDFWKFIEDVDKCFKFVQKYYAKRTSLHKSSLEFQAQFNSIMDEFMKNKGYCCGIWHSRKSRKVQCSGNSKCFVKINTQYYTLNSYTFCQKCFNKLPNTSIILNENTTVDKADFNSFFLGDEESEDFVKCNKCKKLFHERCVLHIKQSGVPFFCAKCRGMVAGLKEINISSEQIPKTECDSYIENFLKQHNIPNCDNIVVRLVSNVPTDFRTKPAIAKYHNENFGHEISYNNCVIFVFLKLLDGTEICFFGIYFQLYGDSKCPEPNKNSVYLSYIDSVKLCSITERTKTYQCILLGLFDYLKMKNFRRVFIWSCPPKRDVDYIFHEKPSDMKIPTKSRLSDWYKKLMQLAVDGQIAESFEGIKNFAEKQNWTNINNIPYFNYDLWPARLEDAITTAEKRSKKSPEDMNLMEKIVSLMKFQIDGFDQQYFVLNLKTSQKPTASSFPEIVTCKWVNNRSNLVDMFFEYNLKYANERLAKFSTSVLLYRVIVDLKVCTHCHQVSSSGLTTSLMCSDCLQKYRMYKIDRSLWNLTKKETVVHEDSMNLFKVSVPITPLLEKKQQNFDKIRKPCLKKKLKDDSEYVVPAKKKKLEERSASSEMFKKQFTPMETRSKINYKKIMRIFF